MSNYKERVNEMLEKQSWMKYAPDLMTEWQQLWEEGKDIQVYHTACEEMVKLAETQDCEEAAWALAKQMMAAPVREDYNYQEPSSLEEIRKEAEGTDTENWKAVLSEEELRDKVTGAWIGRISGCLLGKPVECLRSDAINKVLTSTGNVPLTRYMDSTEFPEGLAEELDHYSFAPWMKMWIDRINGCAPVDDDTNYTVLAMKLIDEYGPDFTPNDVLEAWLYWMPMFASCTAERMAYRNAAMGMYAPETALYKNPYREWIGAQIRGDFFGYLNPGNPQMASEQAWRDASISHVKNGIYGEMFAAAMIAKAAVCKDMEEIIRTGLMVVPTKSRLYKEVQKVLNWYEEKVPAEEAFARIHASYDEYYQHDWCHTNSNAMIVAASLLYGEKDFGKTICLAVQAAFDTDCNGATAGSVIGMLLGEKEIPAYWADGFHKKLRTSIDGYHEVTVEQLAEKTVSLIQ